MKKLLTIFIALSAFSRAGLTVEEGAGSMKVLEDGKLVTEYRTDWKVPYLYPLMSPSGANITRHWPTKDGVEGEDTDHPHHRSVWMGHGLVNGADFWSFKDDKKATIIHKGFLDKGSADGAVFFTADLEWRAEDKKLIDEKRTVTVRKVNDSTLALDFNCELQAAEDLVFGDTKEGMFAFRMDRTLRLKGKQAKSHIVDSNGVADNDTWGKRANWIAYHGPDELGKPAVAALFDHPSNFRYPTWWHVRDYGLVSANPFGIHDFEGKKSEPHLGDHALKKGEKLTFKYRIVIHNGDVPSAKLNELWEQFSK